MRTIYSIATGVIFGLMRAALATILLTALLALLAVSVAVRGVLRLGAAAVPPDRVPPRFGVKANSAFLVAGAASVLLGAWGAPAEASSTLSQAFKRVDEAVVVVRTNQRVPAAPNGQTATAAGIGSGVLVSADGKILTAAHVVQAADAIVVEFARGEIAPARVVASDPTADVALLEVLHVPGNVKPAKLGDSDTTEVGESIFVIGAPLGIAHTLTVGHISARRLPGTTAGGIVPAELFQTDAAINQGNSGGPMFNLAGEVIGVVSHILSRSGGSEGLGFVVTANTARRLLLDEHSVWTGLEGYLLSNELASAFNVPQAAAGLLVQRVAAGSPADKLGLRAGRLPTMIGEHRLLVGGDIILAVEGIGLDAPEAYESIRRRLIENRAAQQAIRVTVLRGGETIELVASF
jgi:S1-C subfamily serine protease